MSRGRRGSGKKSAWIWIVSGVLLLSAIGAISPSDTEDEQSETTPVGVQSSKAGEDLQPQTPEPTESQVYDDTISIDTLDTIETETVATSIPITEDSTFEIDFIDVGQADSILVMCDGHYMLVDGGNTEDSSLIYSYLEKREINYLDYVICTHGDEDHVGGLSGALNYATAGTVYCSETDRDTKAFSNFKKYVEQQGNSIQTPTAGDIFLLGSSSVQILAPIKTYDDSNDNSVVVRIVYGDTSFLLSGDASYDEEHDILDAGYTLKSDVLKVGHHGSSTATSYQWLYEVDPEYAVISVGDGNSYGHPTEEALSRLSDADVTVFRTDLNGTVVCTSDGDHVSFALEKELQEDVAEEDPVEYAEDDYVEQDNTTYVWIPSSGTKYHSKSSCSGMKNPTKVTIEEAIASGFEACKRCW